ncbi:MAG: UvrD-helicase domain-containing protein [Opitutaceae bacterium]
MSALRHEMIFASAGSGKTYALTTRFIRLLALGVAPERIVALTFTRKAAGEFFGEILNRLAAASTDGAKARALAAAVERPEFGPGDFLRLLRAMIGAMHRLNLGTLDGFFAKIVRAFPLELGLSGEPGVLDEHAAAEEMRRVFARLFAARGGLTPEQRALVEAFKLATFGTEGKSVAVSFDRFVAEHLALWRGAPDAACWGDVARIWPRGFPWAAAADDAATARAAEAIVEWARRAPELKDKPRARWLAFAQEAMDWTPGQPLPKNLEFVLERALADWANVEADDAVLTIDRQKLALGHEVLAPLATLVRRVVGLELGRRMVVTQGIAAVMRAFDKLYDSEVRRAGRLTFADLQQLLAPQRGGGLAGAALDYRIDARLDHWLFDEFQDTSYQQWKILEALVDEVVQDPEGRRSLFYVGDVKQAIYTWREGDPRLFAHVAERYRATGGGGIVPGELNDSWRSGPEVIEMVNRVGGADAVFSELFPEAAPEWNRHWRAHRSARPDHRGQAALLLAEDEAGRWATTLRVLQEIRPTQRGLSCAVLVRRNDVGARLADYLRREGGIAAVAEADLRIGTDNPAATALGALLQAAAHPDDGFARRVVEMPPLATLWSGRGLADAAALSRSVLGEIEAEGFETWLANWAGRLETALEPGDRFTRLRLRQLVAAGRVFDERGGRDVDAFLRFLGEATVREPEGAGVVRVMTLHKAKGLGFDVVVLPDLEGQKLAQRREGPAVRKAADRSVDWVLQYPGASLAESDPVLREYLAEAIAENCYEQLSLLYVGLTRAKRATYAVIERPGRSSSLNFPRLLTATLGTEEREVRVGAAILVGTWNVGAGDWFAARAEAAPGTESPPEALAARQIAADAGRAALRADDAGAWKARLVAMRPSGTRPGRLAAGRLFGALGGAAAAEFGTRVHALLAAVEWRDGAQRLAAPPGADGTAWAEALWEAEACLEARELARVFEKLNPGDEVWRERGFEAVLEGAWVSGVLDRVVIRRPAGGPVEAEVYDFKSERGAGAEELRTRHAGQLRWYAAVVAQLLGGGVGAVKAFVVATAERRLVAVEL